MPQLRIVLDPESEGLGLDTSPANVIHLANDAEIVVTGLPDGMIGAGGSRSPSMAFAFRLPDGKVVVAETSWRLFKAAYAAFASRFEDEFVPTPEGLAVEYDPDGSGRTVRVDVVGEDQPQWFECQLCGERKDVASDREGATELAQWVHRHYREKHPQWTAPAVEG